MAPAVQAPAPQPDQALMEMAVTGDLAGLAREAAERNDPALVSRYSELAITEVLREGESKHAATMCERLALPEARVKAILQQVIIEMYANGEVLLVLDLLGTFPYVEELHGRAAVRDACLERLAFVEQAADANALDSKLRCEMNILPLFYGLCRIHGESLAPPANVDEASKRRSKGAPTIIRFHLPTTPASIE